MIYIFGDSFTKGSGIADDDSIIGAGPSIGTTKYENYIWPIQLEKEIKTPIINLGWGGVSNDYILREVTTNMYRFKKGDTVIIGLSDIYRCQYPMGELVEGENGPEVRELLIVPQTIDILVKLLEEGKDLRNFSLGCLEVEEGQLLLEHYLYLFPKYAKYFQRNTFRQVMSICNLLNRLEIYTLVWDNTTWSDFETIDDWTKGEMKDGHWSPNGHLRFTDILKYTLNTQINFLTAMKTRFLIRTLENKHDYIKWEP